MKSKKLLTTITGIISVLLVTQLGLTPEMADIVVMSVASIAGSFNIGQGIADGLSGGKTSSSAE